MTKMVAPVWSSPKVNMSLKHEGIRSGFHGFMERSVSARYVAVAGLLIILFVQATGTLYKSPTFDEPRYLGLGIYIAEHHRWDIEDTLAHPPLMYYLSGLAMSGLHIPDSIWAIPNAVERGQAIIRLYPDDLVIRLARLPIMLFALLMGVYVYRWAADLYGVLAGLLALALFCLNPVITSFAAILNGDTAIAATGFVMMYYWWRFNRDGSRRNLILTGIFFGLTLLSKFSAPMLLPVMVLTGAATVYRDKKRRSLAVDSGPTHNSMNWRWLMRSTAIILTIAVLIAWSGYGFETGFASDPAKRPHHLLDKLFGANPGLQHASYVVAEHLPIPMPSYIKGMVLIFSTSKAWTTYFPDPNITFLMGKYSAKGFWYYHVVGLVLKTPVGTLLLLVLSLVFWRKLKGTWDEELFLIVPFVFMLLYFSLFTTIQVGIRFVLPVIPFAYVFVAKIANLPKLWNSRWSTITIGALVLWTAVTAIRIYPDNLAYFNELAGGPDNGYKWMVDSNLDWGQDLGGLKRYMDRHGIKKIKLAYFGTAEPEYYGIDYDYLPSAMVDLGWSFRQKARSQEPIPLPTTGLIAISATELQAPYFADKNKYSWLKKYDPIAKIGHTIFVYDIR